MHRQRKNRLFSIDRVHRFERVMNFFLRLHLNFFKANHNLPFEQVVPVSKMVSSMIIVRFISFSSITSLSLLSIKGHFDLHAPEAELQKLVIAVDGPSKADIQIEVIETGIYRVYYKCQLPGNRIFFYEMYRMIFFFVQVLIISR